ncbi:alpha/beta hydrolase [Plastorhodobacter daqingensis]|uniref:Alpha/beta hydrolase n=1 Tax=Plastorhodobacter daqingensis TaxID=1387281 RepID=A0ABW2UI43_9RHOB
MSLDDAYANAAFIPGAETFPPRWAAASAALRARLGPRARCGIAYGPAARQVFDLFLPQGAPRGVMIFVHGGYWLAFGPRDWSHLAAGALEVGWAVAMPGYTLAPAARIADMTREVAAAIAIIGAKVAGPIVLTGHSAGGHLVARAVCADVGLAVRGRVARVVPISPLSDLRPLMQTRMHADLGLDPTEAATESPMLHPRPAVDLHVWVGGAERPAFLDQARWLAEAWDCPLTRAPGQHHFNVIEGLEQPDSPLMQVILGGI